MNKEDQKGWFDSAADFKRTHPVALIIAFGSMIMANIILSSGSPLEEKMVPFLLALLISVFTIFFEAYRIQKQNEQKEVN